MRVVVVDLLCNTPFYCRPLVKALCQEGADAELASPQFYLEPGPPQGYRQSPWIADLTVHAAHPRTVRLATRSFEVSHNFWRLLRAIRRRHYEVVHVQWIPLQERQSIFMSRLRAACDRVEIPLVFTAHNVMPHDAPDADRSLLRKNVNLAHQVIAHTDHVALELRQDLGVSVGITVIPHAPLFADFELPSRHEAVARLGLGEEPVVLFQGIIRPYKGLDLLVEAWPLVREGFPTATLAVVGRCGADVSRSHLARLREMKGVQIVDSYVSTALMLDYYAACDVVVFPYKAISQSGALMTAVGLGRPAVVTPILGLIEQAKGLSSVLVADESTAAAVARALRTALSDRDRLVQEAARDRLRVMESPIGWPAVARATIDVYEKGRRAV